MGAAYRVPPEWEQAGAHFGRDGLLYLRDWRRGFTAAELTALFFESQQVRALALEVKNLTSTAEQLAAELADAERRAAFYRNNLILESRLGAMLARL